MISIQEKKNLYGSDEMIRKLEHFLKVRFMGMIIKNYKYTETFIEDNGVEDKRKKHTIGFSSNKDITILEKNKSIKTQDNES